MVTIIALHKTVISVINVVAVTIFQPVGCDIMVVKLRQKGHISWGESKTDRRFQHPTPDTPWDRHIYLH